MTDTVVDGQAARGVPGTLKRLLAEVLKAFVVRAADSQVVIILCFFFRKKRRKAAISCSFAEPQRKARVSSRPHARCNPSSAYRGARAALKILQRIKLGALIPYLHMAGYSFLWVLRLIKMDI